MLQSSCGVSYGRRIRRRPLNDHIMFVPQTLVSAPRFASLEGSHVFLFLSFSLSFLPSLSLSLSLSLFLSRNREREKIFYLAEIIRSVATYARLHAINLFLLALANIIPSRDRIPVIATSFSSWIRKYLSGEHFRERWHECELDAPRTFCWRTIIGSVPFSISHFLSIWIRAFFDKYLKNFWNKRLKIRNTYKKNHKYTSNFI